MAKINKKDQAVLDAMANEKFNDLDALDILPTAMARYSKEVVSDRAIPDVRDGLKPVQRRILYEMEVDHHKANDKFAKLTKITGAVMGNYHPHGDSSINDAAINLSQPWRYNVPLINIEGNNGSVDGDSAAAPRYTEARLRPEAEELLANVTNDAVEMRPTYDNTNVEPTVLPAKWPVLFTNGVSGLGVGYSTNIPAHNVGELLKAAELLNREPESTLDDILKFVKGPDFATGGIVMGDKVIRELYETGKASLPVRAHANIDGQIIHIVDLPRSGDIITKSKLINSMTDALMKADLDSQVKEVEDQSTGSSIDIVIEVKKGTDPQMVLNLLYKKSLLQTNFPANMVAIHNGKPERMTLMSYLQAFVDFRHETVRREFKNEWNTRTQRLELVVGLIKLVDIAEKVVTEIKRSMSKDDAVARLKNKFGFTENQARYIVNIQLYRLSHQNLEPLLQERKDIEARLKELQRLSQDGPFRAEISRQLLQTLADLSEHTERKTEILATIPKIEVKATALIQDKDVVVVVKPNGVQRMSQQVYDNNVDDYDGTVVKVLNANTAQGLMLLTQKGLAMQRIVNEIDNSSIKNDVEDLHRSVTDFVADDQIIDAVVFDLDDKKTQAEIKLVSLTKLGQVKYSPLDKSLLSFNNKGYLTRVKTYNSLKLDGDEVLRTWILVQSDVDKLTFTVRRFTGGRSKVVELSKINEQGNMGGGTNVLKVTKKDDYITILPDNE